MKLQDREHKVTDLHLYTENDRYTYDRIRKQVQAKLSEKHKGGKYVHFMAVKLFMDVVAVGNSHYASAFGCRKFSKVIEAEVAQNMADAWLEEMKLGNYEGAV